LPPGLHFAHGRSSFSIVHPRELPDSCPSGERRGIDDLTARFGHGTSEPILDRLDGNRLRDRAILVIRPFSRTLCAANSPIITQGAFAFAKVIVGMIEASASVPSDRGKA
jgi:hypothetical protein